MRQITQQDIYRHWLGDVIIGNMYNSPLPGRQDDTPSFCLYIKDSNILWKDHGLPDQFGNKAENLVQYMEGLDLSHRGYYQAIEVITERVGRSSERFKPLVQLKQRRNRKVAPYVETRTEFKQFEIDYWNRYGIDIDMLLREDIFPLQKMSWEGEGGDTHVYSKEEDPAFIYWWSRNPASWKLYRPLASKRDKFRQENIHNVIEGWNSMLTGLTVAMRYDTIFITSSTKDRLVVKKVMDKYSTKVCNAINPKGESDFAPIVNKVNDIKQLAKNIFIMYDADDPGYEGSKLLANKTGFTHIDMRNKLDGHKDFSDFVDTERGNHTHEELYILMRSLL